MQLSQLSVPRPNFCTTQLESRGSGCDRVSSRHHRPAELEHSLRSEHSMNDNENSIVVTGSTRDVAGDTSASRSTITVRRVEELDLVTCKLS